MRDKTIMKITSPFTGEGAKRDDLKVGPYDFCFLHRVAISANVSPSSLFSRQNRL